MRVKTAHAAHTVHKQTALSSHDHPNYLVAGARHNLTVVGGESHGQHVLGVAHEAAGGLAGGDLPQAQGPVPRAGQGELTVLV